MAGFAAVICDGRIGEKERSIFSSLTRRMRLLCEQFVEDNLEHDSCLAAKWWLGHSKTKGFARHEETGSWLACVGNPTEQAVAVTGEDFAGRLLKTYLCDGPEALENLNAPFALFIFDARSGQMHAMTDRPGLQRVYYTHVGGAYVLATSSLALAAAVGARLDPRGVAVYFRVSHLLGTQTLYDEIRVVAPATWLTVSGGRLTQRRYWQPPKAEIRARELSEYGGEIAAASLKALDTILAGDAATVLELTGGLDSRMNLSAALATGRPFSAWTIGDVHDGDTAIAGSLAKMAGINHTLVSPLFDIEETFEDDLRTIHLLSDGESDCLNVIASPSVNRQSAAFRSQSITGIGGEIFRGRFYRSKAWLKNDVSLRKLIEWQLCLSTRYDASIFDDTYADQGAEKLKEVVVGLLDQSGEDDVRRALDRLYIEGTIQGAGGRSVTFNNFFYRQAAPFFSNDMLDIAFRTPARFKASGLAVRRAIQMQNPGIAEVALESGLPVRPLTLADAPKVFVSYGRYGVRVFRKAAAKAGLLQYAAKRDRSLASIVKDRMLQFCRTELVIDRMASAPLYKPDRFRRFIERNMENGLPDRTQIGLIASFELTARAAGALLRF